MSEDSLLGLQLDEYRLEALLGRGGMARVYRGLDTRLNRPVAIKVIDTPFRDDEEYVKRFTIEAQAIARLDHPHVVRLYRYGEGQGLLYMAMQFIEGADLGYLLESYRLDGEFIPSADALRLVREVCQALDYIHAHGIIHRDVKPSNIMLTQDDARSILTDFGLALRAEVGTRGEVFGSPHYIAPEQAVSSARAVAQSDLYALGVIAYEMFTGLLPFTAKESMDIAVMHMSSPPPPPRELRPELSEDVEAVLLKALEKKPEDRYQSGRAFALALERALRRQPEEVLPTIRTIPERVTIGLAARPLPPLPPIPAVVTPDLHQAQKDAALPEAALSGAALFPAEAAPKPGPLPEHPAARTTNGYPEGTPIRVPQAAQSAAQYAAQKEPPSAAPLTPAPAPPVSQKPSPWILFVGAALAGMCLLACLAVGVTALFLRGRNQVAGVSQATPTSWATESPFFMPTRSPLLVPTASTAPPLAANKVDYWLKLWRCEDEGCLVMANTGSQPVPLAGLDIEGKEDQMNAAEWGLDLLQPGQCVKVAKDEKWAARMPDSASCEVVGPTLLREGKDRFWTNNFRVSFEDEKFVDCSKKASWCEGHIAR